MLIDTKDYSKLTTEELAEELHSRGEESLISGDFEYFDEKRFGHYFDTVKVTTYSSNDHYSGWADINGNVTLTHYTHDSSDSNVDIFRRDLTSLNDEILRYAEYCRLTVIYVLKRLNYEKDMSEKNGKSKYQEALAWHSYVKSLKNDRLDNDPKYAINAKRSIVPVMKLLKEEHPCLGNQVVWYKFVSSVVSPEEIALEESYKSAKKKIDNEYWLRREELHFAYLEAELAKIKKLDYYKEVSVKAQKKAVKKFWFVASIIGLVIYLFALIGLPSAIKEVYPDPAFTTYLYYYLGTTVVFSPAIIIFIVALVRWPRAK